MLTGREMMLDTDETIDSHLYDLGRELYKQEKYAEALYYFELSAKMVSHYKTLELLGECYDKCGREAEAISALAASVCLKKQPRARILLAEILINSKDVHGECDMIERLLREALVTQPTNRKANELLKQNEELRKKELSQGY